MKFEKFKIKSIVIMPILLILICMNCMSLSVSADWEKKDGKTYYTDESGEKVTGWQTIGDKKYYFSSDGTMRTGWIKMKSGKKYYLKKDGSMVTGWAKIKNLKYYFDKNGVMATGNKKLGQKIYDFADDGVLIGQYKDCFVELDNKYYSVDKDGNFEKNTVSKFVFPDGSERIYYIGKNGYAISTEKEIDGITYVFDKKNGVIDSYTKIKLGWDYDKISKNKKIIRSNTPIEGELSFDSLDAKCRIGTLYYEVEITGIVENRMTIPMGMSLYADFYDEEGYLIENVQICYIKSINKNEDYKIDKTFYLDYIPSKVIITEWNTYPIV